MAHKRDLRVHDEVQVALAVADLLVLQARPQPRQHAEAGGEELHSRGENGELPALCLS
jgi:hypothetical protein